jgi:hypothetical protein
MALALAVGSMTSSLAYGEDDVATSHEGSPERDAYTKNDWPVQPILRPLTLAPKMREIAGDTFLFNLSSNQVAEPIALAPDIRFGLTRRLTLGIIHDYGICISTNGCGSTYNDMGIEGTYSLVDATALQAAIRVGLQAPRFSRFFFGARAGLTMRLRVWPVALVFAPTVYLGMVGREDDSEADDPADATGRADILYAPLTAQLQLGARFLVLLSTGVNGPVSGFSDVYTVPFGFGAVFAINHKVDLGLAWRFENLLGNTGSADLRTLLIRAALRF